MTPQAMIAQRVIDASWNLRRHLGPRSRSTVRRLVDPVTGPLIGSIHSVATSEGSVALTIDDGPDPRWTGPVLDVLARHGSRATFFMLVEQAESHPDLVRRVVTDGHEVGLHGIDHTPLTEVGGDLERILGEGRARLEHLTARPVRWLRPPFGSQSLRTFRAARHVGLHVVVWGRDGEDWALTDPESIAARIADGARRGEIVLLHDGLTPAPPPGHPVRLLDRAASVDCTICALRSVGLTCTSLGHLARTGRVQRSPWFRPSPAG